MPQDPEILVELTSARTEFEAETIAETLRSEGIPAEVFGLSSRVAQWELGINTSQKIMVRRQDLVRAAEVLKANKADSVDLDWSEVDVGQPTPDMVVSPHVEEQKKSGAKWRWWALAIAVTVGSLLCYEAAVKADQYDGIMRGCFPPMKGIQPSP